MIDQDTNEEQSDNQESTYISKYSKEEFESIVGSSLSLKLEWECQNLKLSTQEK